MGWRAQQAPRYSTRAREPTGTTLLQSPSGNLYCSFICHLVCTWLELTDLRSMTCGDEPRFVNTTMRSATSPMR